MTLHVVLDYNYHKPLPLKKINGSVHYMWLFTKLQTNYWSLALPKITLNTFLWNTKGNLLPFSLTSDTAKQTFSNIFSLEVNKTATA